MKINQYKLSSHVIQLKMDDFWVINIDLLCVHVN